MREDEIIRIDINDKYVITSDSNQMVVNEKRISKGEKTAGEEALSPISYMRTVNECYKFLLQRQIRESKASGFTALMEEVRRIEEELDASILI